MHFGFISLSNQEIKEMRRSKSTTPLNFRTQQHLVELSGGRSAFSGHGPCASVRQSHGCIVSGPSKQSLSFFESITSIISNNDLNKFSRSIYLVRLCEICLKLFCCFFLFHLETIFCCFFLFHLDTMMQKGEPPRPNRFESLLNEPPRFPRFPFDSSL